MIWFVRTVSMACIMIKSRGVIYIFPHFKENAVTVTAHLLRLIWHMNTKRNTTSLTSSIQVSASL